jgi:cellulose synthase operon protein C
LNDRGSAEREWREAVRLHPDLLDAWRSLASLAMRKGDMETLDQCATRMISLQSSAPEGYALRGLSNINRRRYAEAELDIRKAIQIAPLSSFGYVQMGNLKFAEHQFPDAAKAYQTGLDLNQNSSDALRGLMNTCVAQKEVDRALAIAEAQISKVPNDGAFYELLGTALFYNKHDLPAAEKAFAESAELDRRNTDPLIMLGEVQAAAGRTDEAIATYRQSLQSHPNEVRFYLLLGDLYQSKQDWTNAENSYQKSLVLTPENPLASGKLAAVMLQSGQNLDVALSLAQAARRGLPTSSAIADTLGWIYYQKGVYPSAIDSLQEALKLERGSKSQDDPKTHFHLGMAYAKNGQTALARQQLQLVLKINPNSAEAADAKKQLAQSKS